MDKVIAQNHILKKKINGRYVLLEEIGEGGMGVVYRATDRLAGETVALKQVVVDAEDNDVYRLALTQEFQHLAGLRHPNIISVLDYGFDAEKRPFFTMTYLLERQTILEAADGQPFERKVELIQQLLQALAYLHRRGVLHRDLKPENVLVVNGTVRLLDFGLAQYVDEEGYMGGSPTCMAPELLDGDPASIESDLYAAGVLFYQVAAGQHPYGTFDTQFYERLYNNEPNLEGVIQPIRPILAQLLSKQPEQRPQSAAIVLDQLAKSLDYPRPTETDAIRESYLQAAKFVGREAEVARLVQAISQTKESHGSVWLVGGESGVGKSRLLNEVRVRALVQGFQVLRGQGVVEGGVPFHLWRGIILRLALQTDLTDLETAILQEVVPSLGQLLERNIPKAPVLTGEAQEMRLVFTLTDLLKRQTQLTLLLLEDLQWAGESLVPLQQILKVQEQLPNLLIIATYRNDERADLPDILPGADVLTLNRLNDQAVSDLSRAMLGEKAHNEKLLRLLQKETEGNTFFIVEVMRALADEAGRLAAVGEMALPETIFTGGMQALLQRRLKRIPTADQPLLQLIAVAGREVDVRLLAELGKNVQVEQWVQRQAEATVLVLQDGEWLFGHDKLRQAILEQLSIGERREAHRKVAIAIETVYPEDARYNEQLLAHWEVVGDEEKELFYILPVTHDLVELSANYERAHRLIERGLELLPSTDSRHIRLLLCQAKALEMQGEYEKAISYIEQGRQLAEESGGQKEIAKCLSALGRTFHEYGKYNESQAWLEQSLVLYQTLEYEDHKGLAEVFSQLGSIARYRNELFDAQTYYQKSLSIREEQNDQLGIAIDLNNLANVFEEMGRSSDALNYYGKSLEIFQRIGHRFCVAAIQLNMGTAIQSQGDTLTAQEITLQAASAMREIGHKLGLSFALTNLGSYATDLSKFEVAEAYLEEALELRTAIGNVALAAYNKHQIGLLATYQGNYVKARELFQQWLHAGQEDENHNYMARALTFLSNVEIACGNFDTAKSYLAQSLPYIEQEDVEGGCLVNYYSSLGTLYFEQGEYELAIEQHEKGIETLSAYGKFADYGLGDGYIALSHIACQDYLAALAVAIVHFNRVEKAMVSETSKLVYAAIGHALAAKKADLIETEVFGSKLRLLTAYTELEPTPEAYFEYAEANIVSQDILLRILMEYGRYLRQSGHLEKAKAKLDEAKVIASASQLEHKLCEIETIWHGEAENEEVFWRSKF